MATPTPKNKRAGATAANEAATTKSRSAQLAAQRQAEAARARKQKQLAIGLGLVVGLLILGLAAWGIINATNQAKVTGRPAHANDEKGILVYPDKAKAGAPKIDVWTDFQCPACRFFEEGLGAEFTKLAANGDISLENHTLTFLEENLGNQWSSKAGAAAACADLPAVNKYPEYFAQVYDHQPAREGDGFSDDILLKQIPSEVGITGDALTAFTACYNDGTMKGFVKAVDTAGRASIPRDERGQWGTPTYAVNGKKLDLSSLYNQQTKTWNAAGLKDLIAKNA